MSKYRKIVWNEGMLLTPHHFQQWDNYHEELLNSRVHSVMQYDYGVLDLQVNNEAIANGNFQITELPSRDARRLVVNVPDAEAVPDLRPVGDHFRVEAEKLGRSSCDPGEKIGRSKFSGERRTRRVQQSAVPAGRISWSKDETSGTNEQPIAYAKSNFRIIFDDELRDGFTSMKIAELQRTPTGQLKIAEDYIPPVLKSRRRLAREHAPADRRDSDYKKRQPWRTAATAKASLADFTTSEVAVFWLLHTINSVGADDGPFFPLAADASRETISRDGVAGRKTDDLFARPHPKDIVKYDHDDLHFTFMQSVGVH